MSIIVQQDETIYSFIIFLQTALHVSGDNFTHHQEHIQTVITTSGTGRTVLATFRCRGGVAAPPRQPSSNVANGHVGGRLLLRNYDLYQRLQLQFYVLLMMGAMDTRNM